ncbi:MAG TPA: ATP-binding protein, partial [Micromonospora sp.]
MALLERDEDLSRLTELLRVAVEGRGGIAAVSGVVGSGKTELLDTLARRAAELGLLVLGATGVRAERSVPLGVLSQLLLQADLSVAGAERVAQLLDAGVSQIRTTENGPDPVAPVPIRIMHGLYEVLHDIARQTPVLVTVDDTHWADSASLQCLLYLVRRLRSARLVVVFAESEHALRANPLFRTELLREPRCLWMHTTRLSV